MLYICPSPIGNLGDVTLRVLDVLRSVDTIACEDTRRTRVLLGRYDITGRLLSFHGHNEQQRLESLLPRLRAGETVALVSDAGMPGLSDPGFTLVRACAAEGLPVTVLPGPSAVSTALVLSGLPADRFAFVGFLPRARTKLVEAVLRFEGTGAALVAFESPRRIGASLQIIAERWPARQVAVCRELTKIHEEVLRGTAAEVAATLAQPVRGEIVLVLEPWGQVPSSPRRVTAAPAGPASQASPGRSTSSGSAPETEGAAPLVGGIEAAAAFGSAGAIVEERAREALHELLGLGVKTKKAAGIVASLTGLPARRAYQLALEVREAAGNQP